ncbi:MAG: aminofutalosine synthase MqnE, partial [Sedimentisphaerales bacterium]|nr:aminofutalosine synthase MqnE [Sedimentisphaerales bacterium]
VGRGGRRQEAAGVVRMVAAARLMLDNVEHVKAFWPMLGVEVAQVALGFGADDIEGTVRAYEIVEGEGGGAMSVERLEGLIREAQREPVRVE